MAKEGGDLIECPIVDCNWNETLKNTNILPNNHGYLIDGKKYSHTIDPRTGLPVTGIKSVTIITKNAEIADAMATPVTIMGVKAGLHMINQMKDIEVVIIDDHDKIHHSTNIRFN